MRSSPSKRWAPTKGWTGAALALALLGGESVAAEEDDGVYGRLDGDLTFSIEAGFSEAVGRKHARGESFAARTGLFYLSTAGVVVQYNEAFGVEEQQLARMLMAGVEIRPLFLGRFARDLERGPAHLDLWVDSTALALGIYNLWRAPEHCDVDRACHDYGMELSLASEVPILPQASTPFFALRAALRWSMRDTGETVMGLITLTFGYHHLFATHLVDARDTIPD